MEIFKLMEEMDCEQLIFCYNEPTDLRAIIAIHNSTLGSASGGCRMYNYPSEEDAVRDVMRLARGMTLKSSLAGVDFGGGKAVIWGDPEKKSEPMLRVMGRFVQGLQGRFITGNDMGTTSEDFALMYKETSHLASLPPEIGGYGDTSKMTALGVYHGMRACLEEVFGTDTLEGRRICIQGTGKVGYELARLLIESGAEVIVADAVEQNLQKCKKDLGSEVASCEEIYDIEADVFSPNAVGGILNYDTIPRLNCSIVAGAANNQLEEQKHGKMLMERGIVYAPDFVVNSGGLIQVSAEVRRKNIEEVELKVKQIYSAIKDIIKVAREKQIPTQDVAEILAMEKVDLMGKIKRVNKGE